jgi:hypothetical protein
MSNQKRKRVDQEDDVKTAKVLCNRIEPLTGTTVTIEGLVADTTTLTDAVLDGTSTIQTIQGKPSAVFAISHDEAMTISTSDEQTLTVDAGDGILQLRGTPARVFNSMDFIGSSDQITITPGGSGFRYIIDAPVNPAASRRITFQDPGVSANFVLSEGASTLNGLRSFGTGISLPTTGGTAQTMDYFSYTTFNSTFSWNVHTSASVSILAVRLHTATWLFVGPIFIDSDESPPNSTVVSNTAIPSGFRPASNAYSLQPYSTAASLADSVNSRVVINASTGIITFQSETGGDIAITEDFATGALSFMYSN